MPKFLYRVSGLVVAAGLMMPAIASATNGYFLIGYGAKSRAMGGVGVAFAQDGLAAASNPAGMSDVKLDTMRIDIGAELFNPPRAYKQDSAALENGFPGSGGAVNHRSGSNLFLIPNMGMIYKFNRKLTIGMAAVGAGLGTRYDQTVPGNPTCMDGNTSGGSASTFFNFNCLGGPTVGVTLFQMQMLPSAAYKINKNHSVGVSLALSVQMFRAYGLQAFDALGFAASTSDLTNRGNDWSYGAGVRLGYLGKFFKGRLALGANYSSRVYMTRFDKYKNLFAEQGSFDIPENYAVGIAVKPTEKITLAFDAQRYLFSSVRSVGNPGPNPSDPNNFFPPGTGKLGTDNGLGFGWQDQWVYKFGVNYDYNTKWSFRAGTNYGKSPVSDDQVLFNSLAPATIEWHATLGASYRPSKSIEWSANFMHAFNNSIKGPTAFGPTAAPVQGENASIAMKQYALGISFAFKM